MEKYKSWSKTSEADGITKRIEVKEAENGFIVTVSKSGFNNKENSPEKYIDERKCWISTENPLKKEKELDIDFEIEEAFEYLKEL